MLKRALLGLTALAAFGAATAQAQSLKVGSQAPSLDNVTWIQGEPISQFESGQVYVIDFWATWCGPCIASIPHVNELHEAYKDRGVNVIGISIWEDAGSAAKFHEKRKFNDVEGDEMLYRVAEDVDRKTANAYMKAAGQGGIPTVMVIGKQGKIEWIGHPMMGLDDVLEAVVTDSFDAVAFEKAQNEKREKAAPHEAKIRAGLQTRTWDQIPDAVDALIEIDPEDFKGAAPYKYMALVKLGEKQDAARWGAQIASTLFAEEPQALNHIAWMIVSPDSMFTEEEADVDFAVTVAEKASDLTNDKDPNVLDTLARAHFVAGNIDRAVEVQEAAVEFCQDDRMKPELETRLEEYRKVAAAS